MRRSGDRRRGFQWRAKDGRRQAVLGAPTPGLGRRCKRGLKGEIRTLPSERPPDAAVAPTVLTSPYKPRARPCMVEYGSYSRRRRSGWLNAS